MDVRTPLVAALALLACALPGRAQAPADATPLILVHGLGGTTEQPARLARRLARGRPVFGEVYAADAEALPPGSVPRDAIFCFGYYREAVGAPLYYADRHPTLASIGGCPAPRNDPHASRYAISYAEQLERAVEGICRATGAEQVDLVGFSMGGIVSRAYTRWRSLRGPNGASRVRRVMTIASPNHGVNVIEASGYVWAREHGPRAFSVQGEWAELDRQCRWWGGRAFIERLNDGWDAFCQAHGIDYASGAGRGHAWQRDLRGLVPALGFLLGWARSPLLVHDVSPVDVMAALTEAAADGDGGVRLASARFDPVRYPHVLFNAVYRGAHDDQVAPERGVMEGVWAEALVRRLAFEGRPSRGFTLGAARVEAVTAGRDASWLLLDIDVTAGTPLCARVVVRPDRPFARERHHGLLLRPGRQRLQLDPDVHGSVTVRVELYGLDGEVTLPTLRATLVRDGRAPAARAVPDLGAPRVAPGGALAFPLDAGASPFEVAFGLDDGRGAAWTPFRHGATALLPLPPPGRYEVLLRARGAPNAAGEWVEADRPDALRLVVEPNGRWSVSR